MDGAFDPTPRLLLTPDEMAAATGGTWRPRPPADGSLSQVSVHRPERVPAGSLYVVPSGPRMADEILRRVRTAAARGAGAVLMDGETAAHCHPAVPSLIVPGRVSRALRRLAEAVRDRTAARRVLVTGTEGKTGTKNPLAHMVADQGRVHVRRSIGNMTDQVAVMLSNLQAWHDMAVIEVAAPTLSTAQKRARLVRPHICVITEVGYEHLRKHGSADAIIEDKASVVEHIEPPATVIIPAGTARQARLRAAVERRYDGRILTFGLTPDLDAYPVERVFDPDRLGWRVRAQVAGQSISLFCPRIEEHAPVSCLAPLLASHALGYDVARAADAMRTYRPYRTEGIVRRLVFGQRRIRVVDKSPRSYLLGQMDMLRTIARLRPGPGGRKILVWGDIYDRREYGDDAKALLPPAALRALVAEAGIDRVYTCGTRDDFQAVLPGHLDWVRHIDANPVDLLEVLLGDLKDNDLLVLYGDRNDNMPALAEALYDRADAHRTTDRRVAE
ncbi:Mur ligase family protein [Roseospira goensis]|uniref:UDP-N-acetylmuramoyl-tripeptide--D-alanyl-D-alanine ligase n=1 Tax=Roseospira goensis TaxID=391922 RepID=A0A7W6S2R9_9PROT|nr:Mur ligase family protein [Roseospira goensis]MBB4287764.1 UDP-N-acetylmuramoyl-tripeptide--D-alanyl-D-alanine ligase [Roseospira goensis]